jgi:hypothetical protein
MRGCNVRNEWLLVCDNDSRRASVFSGIFEPKTYEEKNEEKVWCKNWSLLLHLR